jgi:hypothetical protein
MTMVLVILTALLIGLLGERSCTCPAGSATGS